MKEQDDEEDSEDDTRNQKESANSKRMKDRMIKMQKSSSI